LTTQGVRCGKIAKIGRGLGFNAKPTRRSMLVMIVPSEAEPTQLTVWIGEAVPPLGRMFGASGDDYRTELREAIHRSLTVDLSVTEVEWQVQEAWQAANPTD
jgi:hypothetical protein